MQTKLASLLESVTNLGVGFVLSIVAWHYIGPLFGYAVPLDKNLAITGIFTVISIARSYVMRRIFNHFARRPACTTERQTNS